MALPGHRRTSSDKRRRAAHFALKKINLSACTACKKPVLPHHACAFCGTYGGKKVVEVKKSVADRRKPQAKK
ncbi:MAG: 50S ribosomal protein L32 [bacterium]|nr:50S ribosomal protein L32 [bacterium]